MKINNENIKKFMKPLNYLKYKKLLNKVGNEDKFIKEYLVILNKTKMSNEIIIFKIIKNDLINGNAGKNYIKITNRVIKEFNDNPNILKRLIAHELAHIEFGEYNRFKKIKIKSNKENIINSNSIREIFKETRADWRSIQLSGLNVDEYKSSFKKERLESKLNETKIMKNGYLPYCYRINIVDKNISNLEELEKEVICILKTEFNINISNDLLEIIQSDRAKAINNIV